MRTRALTRASPPALRLVHALVFAGLAASALAAVYPEVRHLLDAWGSPVHPGSPPSVLALASAVLGAAGGFGVLFGFVRPRRLQWAPSASVLAAFAGALAVGAGPPPVHRTWQGADAALLEVARGVFDRMDRRLKRDAAVPTQLEPWREALAEATAGQGGDSEIRTRLFRVVPYSVVRGPGPGALPTPLVPASLVLWASDDGAAFELTPVGLDRGGAAGPLADDSGQRIVFRGSFSRARDAPRNPSL